MARVEASGPKGPTLVGSVSTQTLMRMNTEQASKRAMWPPSLCEKGEGRRLTGKRASSAPVGGAGELARAIGNRRTKEGGDPCHGKRPLRHRVGSRLLR
jgi:hypothetical protein